MAEWEMFPLWEERPEVIKQFRKKERDLLELTIARQVSDLLARHGRISKCEVDSSVCEGIDDPRTYKIIELDEIPLEDNGDLVIDQVPDCIDGFYTEVGAHSVCKEDEDGATVLSLTVWDPEIDTDRRVYNADGKTVSRIVLQELFEALSVVMTKMDAESSGNAPPLIPSNYPDPVIEPELQLLALQFES
jgi:hypothetical protein